MTYMPAPLVVVFVARLVAPCLATTSAAGIGAPCGSVTVPVSVALDSWARQRTTERSAAQMTRKWRCDIAKPPDRSSKSYSILLRFMLRERTNLWNQRRVSDSGTRYERDRK